MKQFIINLEFANNGYIVDINGEKFIFSYVEDAEEHLKRELSKICIKERYHYAESTGYNTDDIPF
jgi:hypothetical protein